MTTTGPMAGLKIGIVSLGWSSSSCSMSCGFVVSQCEMTWLTAAPRALAAAANAGSLGDGDRRLLLDGRDVAEKALARAESGRGHDVCSAMNRKALMLGMK